MTLFDDEYEDEDFTGKVRRTKNGRPYVLANPDWDKSGDLFAYVDSDGLICEPQGFTDKPAEPRGPSALYTRVTTYISCLEDTYSLGQWAERMTVLGLAQRPQLVAEAQRVDLSNVDRARDALNTIAEKAKDAANWKEKADLGSDFHAIAQDYDTGRRNFSMLSDASKAMLAAYIVATKGWEYAHIEQGMVNDEFRTYGTPDRLRWVRGGDDRFNSEQRGRINLSQEWDDGDRLEADPRRVTIPMPARDGYVPHSTRVGRDGKLRVTDIKTGRIDYGWQKMELQLACYALSALYDPDTGIRTELDIDREYAEIVHVPYGEGKCDVYVIPIGEAIAVLRSLVPAVRAWRARKPSWVPAGAETIKVSNEAPRGLTSGVASAWPIEPPEAL